MRPDLALPTLFLSHGSPMHALEPGAVGEVWSDLASSLPRPRALLIASAHWDTNLPMLTSGATPETIHDFFGFPEPLYRIRYASPGSPQVARRALELLEGAGFTAALNGERGLDHGAWSPLLYMYPEADLPVIQLSLQTGLGPRHHFELGSALRPLAGEGVLIIGSGHMTHNLRDRTMFSDERPAAYAREFQGWVHDRLVAGDDEALFEYRSRAPHAVRSHPTDEHFLPLFVALGAAPLERRAERLYDGVDEGVLAMDAYAFRGG